MSEKTLDQEVASLKLQLQEVKKALGNFIAWTAQSANSPIRIDEASKLLNQMNGHE